MSAVRNCMVVVLHGPNDEPLTRVSTFDLDDGDRVLEAHVRYEVTDPKDQLLLYKLMVHRLLEAGIKLGEKLRKDNPGVEFDKSIVNHCLEVFGGN